MLPREMGDQKYLSDWEEKYEKVQKISKYVNESYDGAWNERCNRKCGWSIR